MGNENMVQIMREGMGGQQRPQQQPVYFGTPQGGMNNLGTFEGTNIPVSQSEMANAWAMKMMERYQGIRQANYQTLQRLGYEGDELERFLPESLDRVRNMEELLSNSNLIYQNSEMEDKKELLEYEFNMRKEMYGLESAMQWKISQANLEESRRASMAGEQVDRDRMSQQDWQFNKQFDREGKRIEKEDARIAVGEKREAAAEARRVAAEKRDVKTFDFNYAQAEKKAELEDDMSRVAKSEGKAQLVGRYVDNALAEIRAAFNSVQTGYDSDQIKKAIADLKEYIGQHNNLGDGDKAGNANEIINQAIANIDRLETLFTNVTTAAETTMLNNMTPEQKKEYMASKTATTPTPTTAPAKAKNGTK